MILDSSAVAAICLGEADADDFAAACEVAHSLSISAGTYLEAGLVIDRRRPGVFDAFVHGLGVEVVAVDQEQADLARMAYRTYGRGTGHRASLNFGDCFSYALAIQRDDGLLFKGDDFVHTDVLPAIPPRSAE